MSLWLIILNNFIKFMKINTTGLTMYNLGAIQKKKKSFLTSC